MDEIKEIKIFVSNPSDVDPEKEIVKKICEDINNRYSSEDCRLLFKVKDWSQIHPKFDGNAQLQIQDLIGDYDIYLGIWWRRFGTKTGSINPSTGEEYGSGTFQEFCEAELHNSKYKVPEMRLFFKDFENFDGRVDSSKAHQLLKVLEFKEDQLPKGFCEIFKDSTDFTLRASSILNQKAFEICKELRVESKEKVIPQIEFVDYKLSLPEVKIERTISQVYSDSGELKKYSSLYQCMLKHKKVVLLGGAGSGKSTELQKLYQEASGETSPFIPILRKLNTYSANQEIEKFLPDDWKIVPQKNLLIILDGLDEIQPSEFNTVIRQLNSFIIKYSDVSLIVTCRTNFYEIPNSSFGGTLSTFEEFYLEDINMADAKYYFESKTEYKSEEFIKSILEGNLVDLIKRPYFLMLLSSIHEKVKNQKLNRAEIFEEFFNSRIEYDQNHYKTTIEIRSRKREITEILQRVALSMEIMARNHIPESELLNIVNSSEFVDLKYCTAFNKKEFDDEVWEFEHNNIQEYLAAKALMNLELDKILRIIAFPTSYNKLIPTWSNTLAFLFSLLDDESELYQSLLKWFVENEKETIVKFEKEKIPLPIRIQIFQSVFNYYKQHRIWINSNKFNYRELAQFGNSNANADFLLEEISDKSNGRHTLLNAINLITYLELNAKQQDALVNIFLNNQIIKNESDPSYIHSCLIALSKFSPTIGKDVFDDILSIVGNRDNQYIRSGIYSILVNAEFLDQYLEYLFHGVEVKNSKTGDRSDVTLFDEGFKLRECIKKVNSYPGIVELSRFSLKNHQFDRLYESEKLFDEIVSNAINTYSYHGEIFDVFYEWYVKGKHRWQPNKLKNVIRFFEETGTMEKAFLSIWSSEEGFEYGKITSLVDLFQKDNIQFVVDQYKQEIINPEELKSIINQLFFNKEDLAKKLVKEANSQANFTYQKPEPIDWESKREEKRDNDLKLLFNKRQFELEVLRVFSEEKKESFSIEDLYEVRRGKRNQWFDDYYSNSALRLLREFAEEGEVNKKDIQSWFTRTDNVEWYSASLIYEQLSHNNEIVLSSEQKNWIQNWCDRNLHKIDFTSAITVDGDSVTYSTLALYIWYFNYRLTLNFSNDILLNMLSFDGVAGHDWIGIEHIVNRLDFTQVKGRIISNIQKGIADTAVLKNHLYLICQHKVVEAYDYVKKEILNSKRKDYDRREILRTYYELTRDIDGLKELLDVSDSEIRFELIDHLIDANQDEYVEKELLIEIRSDIDICDKKDASNRLVGLQNIEGLEIYISWIKECSNNTIEEYRAIGLEKLTNIKAVPLLIDLLKLSYERNIRIHTFQPLSNYIIDVFGQMAVVSESNLRIVKKSIYEFIEKNQALNENIRFLRLSVERFESQFYYNKAQNYSISEVKSKLQLLGN
ncbi:NACHT domain-containing protein [Ekhidna sp.]|uniref:NACHT domain-containing protein n=1 Tax=Ekhidna sp. TaxID=2608089 RepID=UPI003C7A9944